MFLHPAQREMVACLFRPCMGHRIGGHRQDHRGVHRAVHLARANPTSRILLTTFSKAPANALKGKLAHLTGSPPEIAGRIRNVTGLAVTVHI